MLELSAMVAEDPNDVRAWLKLGDVYAKRGHFNDALEAYRRGADVYQARDFTLKAYAVHRQMLRIDPLSLETRVRAAELLHELDLLPDAVIEAVVALRLASASPPKRALPVLVFALQLEGRTKLSDVLKRS